MISKSTSIFALYGGLRGAEASVIGSVIFSMFWIIGPALVLGFADEMTQYVFSLMVAIIPSVILIAVKGTLIPGVLGGVLLSVLLRTDILAHEARYYIVLLKVLIVGLIIGLLLWFVWTIDPLSPPLGINRNLFVFYSITGVLSSFIGGGWAAMKIFKDGADVLKEKI